MRIVAVDKGKTFIPLRNLDEIKNNKVEFFIKGEGWKKRAVSSILEEELPDRWDLKDNWLQVCRYYEKYGLHVALTYAECMTAGIIAEQTLNGYYSIYKKIKDHLPENFDPAFFNLLKCEYTLACFGVYMLDIIGLDEQFDKNDTDYDSKACVYKGKSNVSMSQYVTEKYGKEYVKIVDLANTGE